MKKIAIIDDEKDILEVLTSYLSRNEKFTVEDTFVNPLEALTNINSGKYDLVLSDLMMPQMDGLSLLKEVKQNKPNQKFLLMTAFSTEERIIESHRSDADDYITKPFISLRDVENKIMDNLNIK